MSKSNIHFKKLAAIVVFLPLTILAQSPVPQPKLSDVKSIDRSLSGSSLIKANDLKGVLKKSVDKDFSKINGKALQSAQGGMNSGGGDECETRIQEIRDDIRSWIKNGGHTSLTYATSSKNEYAESMLSVLATKKNSDGSVSPATQIECVHRRIKVQGNEKTCRFDRLPSGPKITCDYNAFMDKGTMSEDAQYRLIHHEYAGLARLENPNGSQSQYPFSDQLSAYLVTTQVRKLAIKPQPVPSSFANEGVNAFQAIHNSAPGLTYTRIANGIGQIKDGENSPCTLLYKNEGTKVKLTLIVKNTVSEIELDDQLIPYEDAENEKALAVDYNQAQGVFLYSFDYGHMTNQYTGAHSYRVKLAKKSENSFLISYYHGWADDDGASGQDSYSCVLSTEK